MSSSDDLSRTVAIVALFPTAISTSAVARKFRAAEGLHSRKIVEEKEAIAPALTGAIDFTRANVARIAGPVSTASLSKPSWRNSTQKHSAIPRPAELIERIRKVK